MSFILNTQDIKSAKIEHYIDLAVGEASPQIYKPREGKVNGNLQKYNEPQIQFVLSQAKELIKKFNYQDVFGFSGQEDPEGDSSQFIQEWNKQALEKSIYNT